MLSQGAGVSRVKNTDGCEVCCQASIGAAPADVYGVPDASACGVFTFRLCCKERVKKKKAGWGSLLKSCWDLKSQPLTGVCLKRYRGLTIQVVSIDCTRHYIICSLSVDRSVLHSKCSTLHACSMPHRLFSASRAQKVSGKDNRI